jgi:uncharacterized protein (DUF1330 family)
MAKGYWVTAYKSISDPDRLAAYGKLAGPAIIAGGGRFLIRGGQVTPHDAGLDQRTVVVEFDSYQQAIATYDSPGYAQAREVLGDAVERDLRIVEGVE